MIYIAKENQLTWFQDLVPDCFPDNLPAGISLHIRSGTVGVYADGVVGSLLLKTGETLTIEPKIGTANFLRMLFLAEGSQELLAAELTESVAYSSTDDETFMGLLVRSFLRAVNVILVRSPTWHRNLELVYSNSATGKVDYLKTTIRIAQGRSEPVASSLRLRTLDSAEHRILNAALRAVENGLSDSSRSDWRDLRHKWTKRITSRMPTMADLDFVKRELASRTYQGSRGYYEKALVLALAILGANGLGYDNRAQIEADSHLMNSAQVYEAYLRRTIQKISAPRGDVVTGPDALLMSLYEDGSHPIRPDIIIWRSGKPTLLLDAKYKLPSSGDHYQMHAYLGRFGLARGVLISPELNESDPQIKHFRQPDGFEVVEIRVKLSDLDAVEAMLEAVVNRFA